jgi:tryptophan synthase alpha subunit
VIHLLTATITKRDNSQVTNGGESFIYITSKNGETEITLSFENQNEFKLWSEVIAE